MPIKPGDNATTWRELADQLTPEQIAQVEQLEHEAQSWPEPAEGRPSRAQGRLNVARKMAGRNIAQAVLADLAPPADAIEVDDWEAWDGELYRRMFTSWRSGDVEVCGSQSSDGRVERNILDTGDYESSMTAEQARQRAAALLEAADELDRLR